MRKLKGFTLIELLIVVAIIAILAAIAVPNFLEAQVRSKVSRVRADQRSLATAIETYFVDNNQYPAYGYNTVGGRTTADDIAQAGIDGTTTGATFQLRDPGNPQSLQTLTTPIAYITSYFSDPFADTRGLPFRYARDRAGWILGSYGPNANQNQQGNMNWVGNSATAGNWGTARAPEANTFETLYSSFITQPSVDLLAAGGTYDPTNGTVSAGDVWRVKE